MFFISRLSKSLIERNGHRKFAVKMSSTTSIDSILSEPLSKQSKPYDDTNEKTNSRGQFKTITLNRNQVIVMAGATSAGKSAVINELCKIIPNTEVIVADSVQIYKYADIGSNKPSKEERQQIPHHLVDMYDPTQQVLTSGDFVRLARKHIQDIINRGVSV